jgi:signal transduction histidine kinase
MSRGDSVDPAAQIAAARPQARRSVAPWRGQWASRFAADVRSLRGVARLRRDHPQLAGLVTSLDQISGVVSSRLTVQGVLQTVVDETKAVMDCAKAILCLFPDEPSSRVFDMDVVVVRGSRDEFPEEWWLPELESSAERVKERGALFVSEYRAQGARIACVPVLVKHRTVGLLAAIDPRGRRTSADRLMLLAILAAFAGAAVENARLVSEAQYSLLASERDRIAKEMHDGIAQSLFSASLSLEVCKKRLATEREGVEQRLGEIQTVLSGSVSELRRYIYDLRPAPLDRLGLPRAIETALAEATADGRMSGQLRIEGRERRLDPASEACLYRIAQEAVANAVKHARPKVVTVEITYIADRAELAVIDDGRGFDVSAAVKRSERGVSLGLQSIRDRVRAQGGRLRIDSTPGSGTEVWVSVPC